MKKRRRRRYNNHIWVYSIITCICLLTMGIGYALLSAENNFNIDVTKTTPPAGDTIKALLGSNASVVSGSGTLEKIEQPATTQTPAQTEYRYRGENPNNYVTFNNETWRIIGIVDGKVKLIRNEKIGNYAWNSSGENEWSSSTLKTYLNGDYYNRLNIEAKKMIENAIWYLGGWNTNQVRTYEMYEKERGNTVYSGRSTNWTGYVALMYPSDYGYAASSSCSNTYTLQNYINYACTSNNWLYTNSFHQWTLAPASNYSYYAYDAQSITNTSGYSNFIVSNGSGVRPTIYLKSEVKMASGEGTQSKPYTLQIN